MIRFSPARQRSSRRTWQLLRPNDNKATSRTRFRALIAGLRPAVSILARRIAFPLLLLGAGLVLVQPCAALPLNLRRPAASPPHALITRRRCCPTARCSSQAVRQQRRRSRERGTLRSGERDLDGHRQPRHRTRSVTRRRCCPTARCSSQAGTATATYLASAELYDPASGTWTATGSLATARADTRRRCCPTARCSSQAVTTLPTSASAELYDPASGTWTATGSLATARGFHTATLLPNGKVLVAGG